MANILVINSGSSSIKYQLIDTKSGKSLAKGLVERIGEGSAESADKNETGVISHTANGEKHTRHLYLADHEAGLKVAIEMFNTYGPDLEQSNIQAVGHRVVQGGQHNDRAVIITDQVEQTIQELSPLAPLHNPANLLGIKVARKLFDCPHVAVFDTAFFSDLPAYASTYAIDAKTAEKYQIKRYGAHGTSHQYVSKGVSELLENHQLKQIVMHLGNGASTCAVNAGRPVDTSMGLTPLEGLVMGTRSGDIDPAVCMYLYRNAGMSIAEIDDFLNKKSGMKGLCGDNDMRTIWERIDGGDTQARAAMDIYVHRLLKYVGSYIAVLGGLDALSFTAGIGENDDRLRMELCQKLACFGIEIDPQLNAVRSSSPRVISTEKSAVKVIVYPTNEELAIAEQCVAVCEL